VYRHRRRSATALQAGRAGGQHLDVAGEAVGAQLGRALLDLLLLAERTWVAMSGRE
jgi:hypothetical protein